MNLIKPLSLCLLAVVPLVGRADDQAATFASGTGAILYLAAGVGLPLLRDGDQGKNHFYRAGEAVGTSVVLAEILKSLTRVARPDTGEHDAFPSGHATAAFAAAAMESAFHPKEAPYWYAGASVIGWSRISLQRHTLGEVVGGAVLGFCTAKAELGSKRGFVIGPLLTGDGGYGLVVSRSF